VVVPRLGGVGGQETSEAAKQSNRSSNQGTLIHQSRGRLLALLPFLDGQAKGSWHPL
jgi:hypothetical protein